METEGVTVRLACESDIPAIHSVHISSIKEICASHYKAEEIKLWTERQSHERYSKSFKEGRVYVVERGNEVIGFGHIGRTEDADCDYEVKALYIAPAEVKHGIGQLLLTTLERSVEYKKLLVFSSKNAVGFYERYGFVRIKDTQRCSGECASLECVQMIKSL